MDKEPLISIVVLNYNAGDLLLNCVESLKKSLYQNFEILIVDNISSDGSQTRCKKKFPDIKLIQNEKNLGYCGGNNIGIREAKGDFIVILNPDTVVDTDWLEELISAYKKFGDGLYQPKILSLNEDNIIQSTGNMFHVLDLVLLEIKEIKILKKMKQLKKLDMHQGHVFLQLERF